MNAMKLGVLDAWANERNEAGNVFAPSAVQGE
jgi:hypothetical protein